MSVHQEPIEEALYLANRPVFENTADEIMSYISSLPSSVIADILGVSGQLAVKVRSLAYDFPHKLSGIKAIFGFTGEAFRGLKAITLPEEALERSQKNLRLISSVYGLLNPFDIIKPYRFEFNKRVTPDQKTSIQIYKPKVTIELVKQIKENRVNDIIDLLPGDADKCIDWKIVRAFSSVHKICFQIMTAEGKLKTPIASRLKELRGKMARMILLEDIRSFKELTEASHESFMFSPDDSKPGLPVFITD